jgi:hypothetical protein
MFTSVLRIQDVYPASRILIFTHLGKRGVKKNFWSNIFL